MKKLSVKQKCTLGFVGTIVAAALYLLSMIFGITPNWLADEPETETPPTEEVSK